LRVIRRISLESIRASSRYPSNLTSKSQSSGVPGSASTSVARTGRNVRGAARFTALAGIWVLVAIVPCPGSLSCSPNCAARMKFLPHRRDAGGINSRIVDGRLAAALEILHRALVFLRRCSRGERAQIPSPASPRFDLAGVKPVLARLELPDHPGPPRPCRSASITKKSSVTDSKWKQICPSKIRATGCFQRVRP